MDRLLGSHGTTYERLVVSLFHPLFLSIKAVSERSRLPPAGVQEPPIDNWLYTAYVRDTKAIRTFVRGIVHACSNALQNRRNATISVISSLLALCFCSSVTVLHYPIHKAVYWHRYCDVQISF